MPKRPRNHSWFSDLPMIKLSELFNVNHFIVCQGIHLYISFCSVYYYFLDYSKRKKKFLKFNFNCCIMLVNPHVVPFMKSNLLSWKAFKTIGLLLRSEIQHRANQVIVDHILIYSTYQMYPRKFWLFISVIWIPV